MAYGIFINSGNLHVTNDGKLIANNLSAYGEGRFHNLSVTTPRRVTVSLTMPDARNDGRTLTTVTSSGVWDMSGDLNIAAGCVGNCSNSCGGSCSDHCSGCSGCSGNCRGN